MLRNLFTIVSLLCYNHEAMENQGVFAPLFQEEMDMLTKTTTLNSYQAALGVKKRMNAAMRACASWAMLEEHDKILDMACVDGSLLSMLNDKMRLTLCGLCEQPEHYVCA